MPTINTSRKDAPAAKATVHPELQEKKSLAARFLHISLWTIISLILVIASLEVSFDLANVGEEDFLKIDPLLGFTHLDNKFVTFRTEGYSQSKINANEFRDREYSITKPSNTYRIVVLGDSKVVGFEVPLQNTFSKLLEKELNQKYQNKHFEVMNCGISGYSTGQEYILFVKELLKYQPDMAILAYNYADSDENIPAAVPTPKPYFVIGNNNALQIDWHFVDNLLKSEQAKYYTNFDWLHRNSHILAVWYKTCLNNTNSKVFRIIISALNKPISYLSSKFFSLYPNPSFDLSYRAQADSLHIPVANIYRPSKEANTPKIISLNESTKWANEYYCYVRARTYQEKVTGEIIKQLNAQCNSHNCKLTILGLPAPNNSIFYFDELDRIAELAQDYKFQFINLNRYFPSVAPLEKSPYYILAHFSSAGHALVAKTIIDQLSDHFHPKEPK